MYYFITWKAPITRINENHNKLNQYNINENNPFIIADKR